MQHTEGLLIKTYIHNNTVVRIHGNACRATLQEAAIAFLKKVEKQKANRKETNQNGNTDQSRII